MAITSLGVIFKRPVASSREPVVVNTGVLAVLELAQRAWAALANFASLIAMDILDEWEYYFDYGDSKYTPEIIEKIILAFADKGAYVEFLLSLYQFGCAKIIGAFGDYKVSLPTLQNKEKASDYALKNSIDLLTSYAEIEM